MFLTLSHTLSLYLSLVPSHLCTHGQVIATGAGIRKEVMIAIDTVPWNRAHLAASVANCRLRSQALAVLVADL